MKKNIVRIKDYKKKIVIICLLLLSIIIISLNFNKKAYAVTVTDENNITWYYEVDEEKGTAILTGTNENLRGNVEVPEKMVYQEKEYIITTIGSNAFSNSPSIENIKIPNTVTTIEKNAFEDCSKLKEINVPEKVTRIEDETFYKCTSLEIISLPEGLLYIGEAAFYECESLESIKIPNTVSDIGSSAFSMCSSLKEINIPESIKILKQALFSNCISLEDIVIPEGVTNIELCVFEYCIKLKNITLPDSLTTIGYGVFYECKNLENITIPKNVIEIETNFMKCDSLLNINVSEENTQYTSIDGNLYTKDRTTLIKYANAKIGEVILEDTVTNIMNYPFRDCINIETINISDKIKYIPLAPGIDYFEGCYKLNDINVNEGNEKYSSENGILYNKDKTILYACPKFKSGDITIPNTVVEIGDYAFANCNNLVQFAIPEGIIKLGSNVFAGCINLENIIITDSVTELGYSVFKDCTKLKDIIIPNTVTTMGESLFYGCTNLKSVVLPTNITKIGSYDFYKCNNIETIIIPENVVEIGNNAFDGCNSLRKIEISNNVTTIGTSAFEDCSSLENIKLPENLENISTSMFYRCTSLKSIEIPEGITKIGIRAFYECENLVEVKIPLTVTEISNYAFIGCKSLKEIVIPDNVTKVGDMLFSGCIKLEKVYISNNLTEIRKNMFNSCSSLKEIIIPNSVTVIGESAFRNCSSLINIDIPNSVTTIGNNAFYGCLSLKDVVIPPNVSQIGKAAFSRTIFMKKIYILNKDCQIQDGMCDNVGVTIVGYENSTAQTFAQDNSNIIFEVIGNNRPYKVEYYQEEINSGNYRLAEINILSANINSRVSADAKEYTGFSENKEHLERKENGNILEDGSLILKLYYDRNVYNITYNLNGGTTDEELKKEYKYGEEVELPTNITKDGFEFGGWYANSNFTGESIEKINNTEIEDKVLYAKWIKDIGNTIVSDKYNVDNQKLYISKVSPNTSMLNFIKNINIKGTIEVYNAQDKKIQEAELIGTGYTIKAKYEDGTNEEYKIVVTADIDGNGKVTVTDLSLMNQILVKKVTLTDIRKKAADIDYNGNITITDLSSLNQFLVGKITL